MFEKYKEIMTVYDLCESLGIGMNTALNLLKTGKIKAFKIGRIWKIPKDSLINYINKNTNGSIKGVYYDE